MHACEPVPHIITWRPQRPEKGIRSPEAGVKDDCEPYMGAENQDEV